MYYHNSQLRQFSGITGSGTHLPTVPRFSVLNTKSTYHLKTISLRCSLGLKYLELNSIAFQLYFNSKSFHYKRQRLCNSSNAASSNGGKARSSCDWRWGSPAVVTSTAFCLVPSSQALGCISTDRCHVCFQKIPFDVEQCACCYLAPDSLSSGCYLYTFSRQANIYTNLQSLHPLTFSVAYAKPFYVHTSHGSF